MEASQTIHRLALGDPGFIDQIVNQIKSQGTFDEWRRECLVEVDSKPAFQNLNVRVGSTVNEFLNKQRWRPDLAKNQLRETLRKHILELGVVEKGVDRMVEQVVQPKVLPKFHPAVETGIYDYLGIEKPVKPKAAESDKHSNAGSPIKKAFKPMPVLIPIRRDQDGVTPPPGEEFTDLEAITPSPISSKRSRSQTPSLRKDDVEEVSDVSMEDISSRPAEMDDVDAALERICSSPESNPSFRLKSSAVGNRAVSALSAISSGDELPSSTSSPPTSNEQVANKKPPLRITTTTPIPGVDSEDTTTPIPGVDSPRSIASSDNEDMDDDSDSSSPEFERLEIVPRSNSADFEGDYPEEDKIEQTDSGSQQEANRKSPDDEKSAGASDSNKIEDAPSSASSEQLPKPTSSSDQSTDPGASMTNTTGPAARIERSKSSSSRSKSESYRSERKDKSSSSSSRKDKERDREREREREKRREREERDRKKKKRSKSERRDREDEKKKSSNRDRERERQKDKEKFRSSEQKMRSGEEKKKSGKSSPSPPPTNGWKRPDEMCTALRDYLARFGPIPDEDGDDHLIEKLVDVTASSISSYEDSDAETPAHRICLSEVELDSALEEELVSIGGRVTYLTPEDEQENNSVKPEPIVERQSESEQTDQKNETVEVDQQQKDGKRLRRVNTRYSDNGYYVGSELRRVISQQSTEEQHSPKSKLGSVKDESESSTELPDEPQVKRGKVSSASSSSAYQSPSSPESSQSDHPSNKLVIVEQPDSATPPPPGEDEVPPPPQVPSSPVTRRRSAAPKQPQQRYDDTDLYKPRPVITPSSRRSRRPEDS